MAEPLTPEAEERRNEVRIGLVLSDPDLTDAIVGGGAFGGAYSPVVAQNMFDGGHTEAIEDAERLVEIVEVCPRSWLTRTLTCADTLSITVGGERFDLVHRRGETDDQLYVEEWAVALREMVALAPDHLLPAHGDPISGDPERIAEVLGVHAEALEHIVAHTLAGLNARLRQDVIADSVSLPERLASHPTLNEQYVSPADISRMVMKQYCGWWDDIPSHWAPARFDQQAAALAELVGGVDVLVRHARDLVATDPVMACHFVDWAWFADPTDRETGRAVIEIYIRRIADTSNNTQEALMYLDHMTDVQLAIDS